MLKGNMLVAHGGGPTPVINSSLLGAVREAKKHPEIETIYGARFGAEGILAGDLIDLGAVPDENARPARAHPRFRHRLLPTEAHRRRLSAVLECFKKFNIRYFFYNGGNDSMDTCNKVYQLAVKSGYELRVIGIPKTIDNDLAVTDHCPGFGSAAKYAAASALEIAQDAAALPIHVVVMEMMGRNAGLDNRRQRAVHRAHALRAPGLPARDGLRQGTSSSPPSRRSGRKAEDCWSPSARAYTTPAVRRLPTAASSTASATRYPAARRRPSPT